MKLVTVATHSERYYPYLKLSAEKYGHDLVTLGWGEKWQGFTWRLELIKKYLTTVARDEIICIIDGYDVVVLQDPKTIETTFIRNINGDKSKIFISKEQYSHNGLENTILSYIQSYVFTKCKNEYLNAGSYMGTASTIIDFISDLCNEYKCESNMNDQRLLQDYCTNHSDKFIVDDTCETFVVINSTISSIKPGEYDISFKNNRLVYKDNVYPAFFHGNGYTDFDYIIKELGYDTTLFKADGESKVKYVWDQIKHYIPYMIQRCWIYIIIFIILIVYIFKKPIFKKSIFKNRSYRFK